MKTKVTRSSAVRPLDATGLHHHPVEGWRYILIELGIVTAGLFVALMLNSVVEWVHHKQLVHDARRNIQREISENRHTVAEDLALLQSSLTAVDKNIAELQLMRTGQIPHGSITNTITYGTLDNAAWVTARDTGALPYMTYDEAQRYSNLYGAIEYVNRRGIDLIDDQRNASAPALMGYDSKHFPPDVVISMLRANAEMKMSLLNLIQMLLRVDAQLRRVARAPA